MWSENVIYSLLMKETSHKSLDLRRQQNKPDWDELGSSNFIFVISMAHMLRDESSYKQ